MKIACTGLDLPEGKIKHVDPMLLALAEKFRPKKVSPYFFEFVPDQYEQADAIVMAQDRLLDLLILDIEKLETRIERSDDENERALLRKCLAELEKEIPVCDMELDQDARELMILLGPLSLKPTLVVTDQTSDTDTIGREAMKKAGKMFFYTAGKQEVHAWFVDKSSDAVTCAGKIHTDLARGFIKAETVSFDDLMTAHNLQDAREKGLTNLLDKNDIIEENTVIDIRFNV